MSGALIWTKGVSEVSASGWPGVFGVGPVSEEQVPGQHEGEPEGAGGEEVAECPVLIVGDPLAE